MIQCTCLGRSGTAETNPVVFAFKTSLDSRAHQLGQHGVIARLAHPVVLPALPGDEEVAALLHIPAKQSDLAFR